jgi:outer membrane protein, heavy metal efflux system
MTWKPLVSAVGAAILATIAEGQTAPARLHLDEIVRIALERNRELVAFRQRVNEQRGLLRHAGLRPVPGLEVGGSSGRPVGSSGEHSFSAVYSYQIETFGKRAKRIAVAERSIELTEAEVAQRSRELILEVRNRYIDALASRRKLDALERLGTLNREMVRLTQARVEQGETAPLDRNLFMVEASRVEAQRADILGRERAALLEITRLAGLSPTERFELVAAAPPAPKELTELRRIALHNRPDLRVARVLEEQTAAEIELAEAQGRPDITISAGYSQNRSSFPQSGFGAAGAPVPIRDTDNIISAAVSLPLLTRKRNLGNIEAAQARAASARIRREYLESAIPLEVEAAYQRWTAAQRSLETLERGVIGQSEKNLEVLRAAYGLGELRMLDVLNEQRRLMDTQLFYIDAQAEAARAVSDLERALGTSLP